MRFIQNLSISFYFRHNFFDLQRELREDKEINYIEFIVTNLYINTTH